MALLEILAEPVLVFIVDFIVTPIMMAAPELVPFLRRLLNRELRAETRHYKAAIKRATTVGDAEALASLYREIDADGRFGSLKFKALNKLAPLDHPAVDGLLEELLGDPDRWLAMRTLNLIRRNSKVNLEPAVARAAESEDRWIAQSAVDVQKYFTTLRRVERYLDKPA